MRLICICLLLPFCMIGEEIPPLEKQVICVTIPKAGTHLLKKAMQQMLGFGSKWMGSNALKNEASKQRLFDTKDRFQVLHIMSEMEDIKALDPSRFAKILLIRDPRDVMISFFYHIFKGKPWPFSREIRLRNSTFEEQVSHILHSSGTNVVQAFTYAALWMKDPTIFVVRFEDLIGEKGGGSYETQMATLKAIASFVGCSVSEEKLKEIALNLFGGTVTFRQGLINGWKTFAYEDRELFKSRVAEATIELGYETNTDW